METLSYKTKSANKASVKKEWLLIDATGQTLGRLSSKVAYLLRGKHKPYFTPHTDCGDNIIIINAEKVKLSGNKITEKQYIRYTGYPGGQRVDTPKTLLLKKPTAIVELAIQGMLPKTRLGADMFRNLHVYAGNEHPHQAQTPKQIDLSTIKE